HSFNHNRGNFLRRCCRLEESFLDPVQRALSRAAIAAILSAKRITKLVGKRNVHHVQCLSLKSQALGRTRRGQRKRTQSATVKTIEEGDELFAAGCMHREFQSSLDGFSATVCKVSSRRR